MTKIESEYVEKCERVLGPERNAIVGRCVEVGDDDNGNPMILIHTTREELMSFRGNIVYQDVEVCLLSGVRYRPDPLARPPSRLSPDP